MTKNIEDIMQDIRDLRDADFHVCKYDKWQSDGEPDCFKEDITCSCVEFDNVIDKLEKLIKAEVLISKYTRLIKKIRKGKQ